MVFKNKTRHAGATLVGTDVLWALIPNIRGAVNGEKMRSQQLYIGIEPTRMGVKMEFQWSINVGV